MVQIDPTSRFTVLLPSEQEGWHQTVAGLLEPQGVHTVLARSGREALDLIESTPFHAVVLDTQMPGLGGLQVIKLMNELHRSVPAILLTDQMTNYLLREALGMRVFSVLSKPVELNLLLDALARILRRYHENRWPND
ncbi:MAG TPA: response regulator [Tepidisphaeraceae bacterium]|nr:response regulator [Tepidisphaeraceae bacterium]